eukprot:TRINITY_DN11571_c0_g1_i1.p1 TRINITY_DN11571_c0_g1~~TRINITY_DN11571_c0_g1_i1.p1  ORF type:complete len:411 (+),score=60.22 TRINITY_DN11571_c0_g1_i1:291-1523(+)
MERVDSVHRSPLLGDRACGCGADLLESKRQPLCRRSGSFPEISAFASKPTVELGSRCKANASLPKGSPYVGFQRHSPPSPVLGFKLPDAGDAVGDAPLVDLDAAVSATVRTTSFSGCGTLPDVVLCHILAVAVEVKSIATISRVARGFRQAVRAPTVWSGRRVHIPPQVLEKFAPWLQSWLRTWKFASKLVVPNSAQLLAEVTRCSPALLVEVAWRFSSRWKASGVEVLYRGNTVQRTADDELVVIGDASFVAVGGGGDGQEGGREPYVEVRIDERPSGQVELNDMGIGFTMSDPDELQEMCAVADEIPSSWVVDFTQSLVLLSVNNREVARGRDISAADLHEGDRVGLRLARTGALEVYINGDLRQSILPEPEDRVPIGAVLYPLFDLYGLTARLSCTGAEEPKRILES